MGEIGRAPDDGIISKKSQVGSRPGPSEEQLGGKWDRSRGSQTESWTWGQRDICDIVNLSIMIFHQF